MPHCHWFTSYTPCNIPIRLTNSKLVYVVGVGSVRFQPVVEGQQSRVVKFTRVLHVPELHSNLLSVMYLTQHKTMQVIISHGLMSFVKDNALLFTVSVNDSNSTLLDGQTVLVEHQTQPPSTCALDLTLWHRRLGHVNMDYVQQMAKNTSVLGLRIDSDVLPDPICEPCISGKQHQPPVPHTAHHRASEALDLVHMDVHGPLPVQTQEGYRYWTSL
jgi:hypothetical protein